MKFFRENKFLAVVITITVVLAILLLIGIFMTAGKYKKSQEEFNNNRAQLTRLQSGKLYPTEENQASITQAQIENDAATTELAKKVAKSKIYAFPASTAAQMPSEITEVGIAIRQLAQDKKVLLPGDFYFGLERFKDTSPSAEQTPHIAYQLDAYASLLKDIIQSGVTSIDAMTANANSASAVADNPQPNNSMGTVTYYPFQIRFTASMNATQKILNAIPNYPNYIFDIRVPFIENEKKEGLSRDAVNAENTQNNTGNTVEDADKYDARIILGNEKITTQLDIDLVRFVPSDTIRDMIKNEKATEVNESQITQPTDTTPATPETQAAPTPPASDSMDTTRLPEPPADPQTPTL